MKFPELSCQWNSSAEATRALEYLEAHDAGLRRLLNGLTYGGLMDYRRAYESVYAYVAHQCGAAMPTLAFIED